MKKPAKSARPVRFAVVGLGHIAQAAVLPAFKHARRHAGLTARVPDDRAVKLDTPTLQRRRPTLRQNIHRPPVAREPRLST